MLLSDSSVSSSSSLFARFLFLPAAPFPFALPFALAPLAEVVGVAEPRDPLAEALAALALFADPIGVLGISMFIVVFILCITDLFMSS